MLTKALKSAAQYYALCGIDLSDVEYLTGISAENLPEEFFTYAKEYADDYDKWLIAQLQDEELRGPNAFADGE